MFSAPVSAGRREAAEVADDLLDLITLDDLDEEQRQLAELIGLEAYKALINSYAGTYLYIPNADRYERIIRDRNIRAEFDGYNFKELAIKYGLTEIWIRRIVADEVKLRRAKPIDGQVTFWGQDDPP